MTPTNASTEGKPTEAVPGDAGALQDLTGNPAAEPAQSAVMPGMNGPKTGAGNMGHT
jgi:hypothetical protein